MIFHTSDADIYLSRYFGTVSSTPAAASENNDFLNKAYKLLPKKQRENAQEIPKFVLKHFGQDIARTEPFGTDGAHCLYERNKFSEDDEGAHHDVLMRCIKFSFFDVELKLANDMGFITTLQLHIPFVYKMGFRGLTNVTSFKLNSPNAEGDFHFKFGSNFMVKTSLFVETPLKRKYGYTLKTHAGVKLSLVLNNAKLKNIEFETKKEHFFSFLYYPTKGVFPTANPYKLLFYKSSAQTFAHTNVLKYPANGNEKQRHYSYGQNYFGVGLSINYSCNSLWPDIMSYSHFKSFFHKGTEQNDYFEWSDKLFAGLMGFHDYLLFNPIGKPFEFSVNYNHVNTDHFAVDTRFARHVKPLENNLEATNEILVDVREEGEVPRKWLFQYKSISSRNSDSVLIEFDHKSPNNQSIFAIRLELNDKTTDYIEILIDPVSNPDKELRRFYNGSIFAGSTFEKHHNWLILDIQGKASQSNAFKVDQSILNDCKHDRDKGFEYSFVCWLLKKQRGRLHNFSFAVHHEESENVRLKFLRSFIWLLHHLHNNLEIDLNSAIGDPNEICGNFNFSNSSPHVDVSISRSDETYKLSDIFIPSFIPHFEHITVVNSEVERLLENALYIHQPKCIISGDYVQTTDRIVYQFPMGTCYHVVFADCYSKRVIILMNQSGKNSKVNQTVSLELDSLENIQCTGTTESYIIASRMAWYSGKCQKRQINSQQTLKVFFDSAHEIDVKNNLVKINRAEELKNKHHYIHIDNSTSREVFTVTKHLNRVHIDGMQHFGVSILFDGKNAVITVTNWLRGLQCGLCGNFDGEKSNEFIRSDGMQTANATDFARMAMEDLGSLDTANSPQPHDSNNLNDFFNPLSKTKKNSDNTISELIAQTQLTILLSYVREMSGRQKCNKNVNNLVVMSIQRAAISIGLAECVIRKLENVTGEENFLLWALRGKRILSITLSDYQLGALHRQSLPPFAIFFGILDYLFIFEYIIPRKLTNFFIKDFDLNFLEV
uniref:VWFD domain-containing protein n=1 Tax=Strigamia maritima TaxID=126957 RepID=T1J918_STRMM